MKTQELLAKLVSGYAKNKPHLKCSIGIISQEKVERFWFGSDGMEIPLTDESYEIGSVTKTITASFYANAIKKNDISLNDRVFHSVTVKDLLTHTSGIGELPEKLSTDKNPFFSYTEQDILKYIKLKKFDGQPGWEYSNLGYAVLGLYLEKVYHKKYADLISDFICHELCLKQTRWIASSIPLTGYNYQGKPSNWSWSKNNVFLPAGGLASTLNDMLCYLALQINSGRYDICHSVHAQTDQPFDMGLAWMIEKNSEIVFSMGLTEGFSSFLGYHRAKKAGIVILSNYFGPGYGNPNTPNGIGRAYLNQV